MTLDPDVERLFELMRAAGVPPLAKQTVAEARLYYREKSARLGGPAIAMAETRDLAAAGPVGPIPLRFYRPEGAQETSPALIYVHGGGWVIGDLDSHDKVCRGIAAGARCRVVAVDYRRAPEHPFPTPLNDVIAATNWIASNAASLGIDASRIAIGGDSAGGSMSACTCLAARENGPGLRAQVLIYPSTDSTAEVKNRPSRIRNAEVPPLTTEALKWFSSKYLPGTIADRRDWRLSPLFADSLSGLPAALVLTAEYDPLLDEGKAYADRLVEAGVPTIYHNFPGQIHGFIEFGGVLSAAPQAVQMISQFLQERL
jgi:acetyl esterase